MLEERPFYETILDYAVFAPIGLLVEVVEDLPKLSEKGRQRVEQQVTLARLVGRLAFGQVQRKFDRREAARSAAEAVEVPTASRPTSRSQAAESVGAVPSSARSAPPARSPRSAPAAGGGRPSRPPRSAPAAGGGRRSRPSPPPGRSGEASARSGAGSAPGPAAVASSDGAAATTRVERAPAGSATDGIVAAVRDELGAEEPGIWSIEEAASSAAPAGERPSAESLAIPGYDTLAASQVVQRLSSLEPDELEAIRRYEVSTRGRRTILHRIAQLSAGGGRATA